MSWSRGYSRCLWGLFWLLVIEGLLPVTIRATSRAEPRPPLAAPQLYSPRGEVTVLNEGVHFLWSQPAGARYYELQYSQEPRFVEAISQKLIPLPADRAAYLPAQLLESGAWYWRVRALDPTGQAGPWSASGHFHVKTSRRAKPPGTLVSTDHPLFLWQTAPDQIAANWAALPADLKPHTLLRIEKHKTEEIEPFFKTAQAQAIPLAFQLAGPHNIYNGSYARIPLSDVEAMLQRYDTIKALYICEQSIQGGIGNPEVVAYFKRLVRLAQHYGKLVIWADGHWFNNNLWLDLGLNRDLFEFVTEHKEYIIPMWKMNAGFVPYTIQGGVFGLWVSGAVTNYGVQPESWFWHEAGFGDLNQQGGFKEGIRQKYPLGLYGQMFLLGLSAGATVYCLEPGSDIWAPAGQFRETWTQVWYPLLQAVINRKLIPRKSTVVSKIKCGYVCADRNYEWLPNYAKWARLLYEATYQLPHQFAMIPQTGDYYWIPLLSPYTPIEHLSQFNCLVRPDVHPTAAAVKEYIDKTGRSPEAARGTAWWAQFPTLALALNSYENHDIKEQVQLPLSGRFASLEAELEVNGYLVADQPTAQQLRLLTYGRPERQTILRLKLSSAGKAGRPPVVKTPDAAAVRQHWRPREQMLQLEISHPKGTVQLELSQD